MFYLSFLIRDGKCALEIEEETEEPMISTLTVLYYATVIICGLTRRLQCCANSQHRRTTMMVL